MEKKIIKVPKETKNFICKKCKHVVDVSKAKPWNIETDEAIIKTWDYGHQHDLLLFPSDIPSLSGFRKMQGKI